MGSGSSVSKDNVPDAIDDAFAQNLKKEIRDMVPRSEVEDYYPSSFDKLRDGKREGDAQGTGPGMVYASGVIKLLKHHDVPCFSGLHVPVGEDWKMFMKRLHKKNVKENGDQKRDKKAKCKVLLVLLTQALFESIPCLYEIYTAIVNKIKILPIRLEEDVKYADAWSNAKPDDENKKSKVLKELGRINAIPHTLLTVPDSFDEVMEILRDERVARRTKSKDSLIMIRSKKHARVVRGPSFCARKTWPYQRLGRERGDFHDIGFFGENKVQ